jgi:hypothetical protein
VLLAQDLKILCNNETSRPLHRKVEEDQTRKKKKKKKKEEEEEEE